MLLSFKNVLKDSQGAAARCAIRSNILKFDITGKQILSSSGAKSFCANFV